MRCVLAGGSGQVGTLLARHWAAAGHDVVVLSRQPAPGGAWRTCAWDARPGAAAPSAAWVAEVDGADVVVNLAGRSVNCRYTAANLRAMRDSRVASTEAVGAAIAAAARPPPLWLQMSTATVYAHRFDAANDEDTGIVGGHEPDVPAYWRTSVDIAQAWEAALAAAPTPHTRRVALRTAMVMSPDPGGIFSVLRSLARCGLGGAVGGGRQFVSWIHGVDFCRALDWLVAHPDLHGAINVAAPTPLPQAALMRALRAAARIPVGLPATRWMAEIGAWVLRTDTELLLKSRRVVPTRLLASGFTFTFESWPAAAEALCRACAEGSGGAA